MRIEATARKIAAMRLWIIILLWFGTASVAMGDEPATAPADMNPAVAPFVTAGTLVVAEGDPSRFDLDAVGKWLSEQRRLHSGAPLAWDAAQAYLPKARSWLDHFKAAGVENVYAVSFLGNPAGVPAVLIVPIGPQTNAKAVAGLLVSGRADGPSRRATPAILDESNTDLTGGGVEAAVIHNAVVYGYISHVEEMKEVRPVDRPSLAAALAALGDSPFKIVASPSIALQLAAGELLPEKLPDEAGGGDPIMLVHSLDWLAIGLTPPPSSFVHLLIQCKDPDGAAGFSDMLGSLIQTGATVPSMAAMGALLLSVRNDLSVHGDQLSLSINGKILDQILAPQIVSMLASREMDHGPTTAAATQP